MWTWDRVLPCLNGCQRSRIGETHDDDAVVACYHTVLPVLVVIAFVTGGSSPAHAGDNRDRRRVARRDGKDNGTIEEPHDRVAGTMMALVGLLVAYLLVFKRPLGRVMLFLDTPRRE